QEAFQRAMERAELNKAVKQMKQMASDIFSANDVDRMELANAQFWEILTRKYFLRTRFPQSFAEVAGNPPTIPRIEPYYNLINSGPGVDLSAHDRYPELLSTESSELLYLVLTRGDVYGVSPVGQDEFSTSEVADTDGDGLLEFVDGWG